MRLAGQLAQEMFRGFHPSTRKVLWRILVAQAHLYKTFLSVRDASLWSGQQPLAVMSPMTAAERTRLDWRTRQEDAPDVEVLEEPFTAAERYLAERLGNLTNWLWSGSPN
jgi:hypothetical protein